jgi:hypothetical protein
MQLKQPLTLLDVALTCWHVLGVLGTYQRPPPALAVRESKRGIPSSSVDCRATLRTAHPFSTFPLTNQWAYLTQIGRKHPKTTHRFGDPIRTDLCSLPLHRSRRHRGARFPVPSSPLIFCTDPFCLPVGSSFSSFSQGFSQKPASSITWIRREECVFRAEWVSIWRPWRVSFLRGSLSSVKVGV